MEKKPSPKCENGHDAHRLCTRLMCLYSAPICNQNGCEHSTKHQKCVMASSAEEVVQLLMENGSQYSIVDEQVIKCYDQILKLVEIEKQEFTKLMKEPGMRLKGDEGKLFRLLKEGPTREIKPAMVHKVIERLTENTNSDVEKLKSEAKEEGQRVIETVVKGL